MRCIYLFIVAFFGIIFALGDRAESNDRKETIPLNTENVQTIYFTNSDPVVALYHLNTGEPLPDGTELASMFKDSYGYSKYKKFAGEMSRTQDAFKLKDLGAELHNNIEDEIKAYERLSEFSLSNIRIEVEPYDFDKGGYVICCFRSRGDKRDGYMTGMGVGNYVMQYRLPEMKIGYPVGEETARRVESIFAHRKSRTLSTSTGAVMHFEVESAKKQTIQRKEYNVVTAKPTRLDIVDYLQEFEAGSRESYETLMSIDLTQIN